MKSGDPEHEKHNTSHGKEMIMKELRIAIIGCGMISHRHMTVIENLKALGYKLEVVAAAEIKKDRLLAWGKHLSGLQGDAEER